MRALEIVVGGGDSEAMIAGAGRLRARVLAGAGTALVVAGLAAAFSPVPAIAQGTGVDPGAGPAPLS